MNKDFLIIKIIIILIGLQSIICCRQIPKTDFEKENDITFDSITVNEAYHLYSDSAMPFCTLKSTFVYPSSYEEQEILQQVNQIFISTFFGEESTTLSPDMAMNKYVENYLNSYKAIESDFKKEEVSSSSSFEYYETSSNEILYNKRNIISFANRIEYYTGGAHGSHSITYHVVNLNTGKPISEEDIFDVNYQEELAKIIIEAIALNANVENPSELEKIGYFNVKEIYPNKNFYLNDKGITYTYNEYEIAAYFFGITTITIPYENVRHLLKENSIIYALHFLEK